MKHYFSFKSEPSKALIDRLIEMCTADGSIVDKISINYVWVRTFGGHDLIVKVWTKIVNFHGESDGETEKANAALIAAAPNMYRMLKYLADGVRWGGIQHTDRSLATEIENLLKKARGEE